ncbi:MAG: hypothetical protein MK138_09795 [Planctomycetes bacterium]|nr:hypothetical protein [Planctomycetota bacterium]
MKIKVVLVFVVSMLGARQAQSAQFIRGDSNLDGQVDISDPVALLGILFLGNEAPGCADAQDANDSGEADISDAIFTLAYLFSGGRMPPPPFGECGCDETDDDALDCQTPPDGCSADPCGIVEPPQCIDQEFLTEMVRREVAPIICIAPDAAVIEVTDTMTATVCPADEDTMCEGEPGCPVAVTEITTELDMENERLIGHMEGNVRGLTIRVDSGFGGDTDCQVDIDFSGDMIIPFVTGFDDEDNLILVEILPIEFDRDSVVIDLSASGGFICSLLAGFQDLFIEDLITQLETAAGDLLFALNVELAGLPFCDQDF